MAPAFWQNSRTATLSFVLPDSDGITAIDCGPRCADPVATISAAHCTCTPNSDRAASSAAAGCISIPAPPAPRKNTFRAPSARHLPIAASRPAARPTAPA